MEKTKLSINTGLKLVVWGIPLGLVLRLVQMNFFFDFDTGFYTDGGVTAWVSLLLPAAMAVAAAVCFNKNSRAFTEREQVPAKGPGAFAGASGGTLLMMGCYMLEDYADYNNLGLMTFETTQNTGLHIALAVLCLVFGALQSVTAAWLCMGSGMYKKAPLLYLPGVAWGMLMLVAVYVFYARSSSTVENLFTLVGSALMLMSLFYLCAALGGAGEPRALKRLFIFGGLTAVLVIPYDLSNVALAMMGKTYFGELPGLYSLVRLAVGMFVLAFMLSSYRTGVDKELDGASAEPKQGG